MLGVVTLSLSAAMLRVVMVSGVILSIFEADSLAQNETACCRARTTKYDKLSRTFVYEALSPSKNSFIVS